MFNTRKEGTKQARWVAQAAMFLVVLLVSVGCSERKPPPMQQAVQGEGEAAAAADKQSEEDKKREEAEKAREKELESYFYTPIGKRDPFRAFYMDINRPNAEQTIKQEDKKPKGPLEKFDIEQMKLVAIITGLTTPRAMIELPNGKGYIIKPGTAMGKNGGRVAQIRRDKVVIEEEFIGTDGSHNINQIVIQLHQPETEEE